MRPIDADELQTRFYYECIGNCACCQHSIGDMVNMQCKLIEDAPTLDEDKYPCENCEVGWSYMSSDKGYCSCEETCERFKQYWKKH